jgi:hypothetical protein
MQQQKPREKEKGTSKRARMGRVLHETAGKEKGRRRGSGRGGKTDTEVEHEKGTGEGRGAERMVERIVELMSMKRRGIPGRLERRRNMPYL